MNFPAKKKKCQEYLKERGWVRIGDGRGRTVYCKKNSMDYVLKLPIQEEAQQENRKEVELSSKDDRYANARKVELFGVDCVLMEYITPEKSGYGPPWSAKVDQAQVGKDKNGKWKAFDFPDDPLGDGGLERTHDEIVEIAVQRSS